jgi:hypothetical protein
MISGHSRLFVVIECLSLLFLQKDVHFVFSSAGVLKRLGFLRDSCPLVDPLSDFRDSAAEHFSLVSKLTGRRPLEDLLSLAAIACRWRAIGELCGRFWNRFDRPLFDVFSALCPIGGGRRGRRFRGG